MAAKSDFSERLTPITVTDWIAAEEAEEKVTLPDFARMTDSQCDPNDIPDDDKLAFAAPFRRIFGEANFIPLLIEIAAIEDNRQTAAAMRSSKRGVTAFQSNFVSNIVSYFDSAMRASDPALGSPLIDAWHQAIAAMNDHPDEDSRRMCDFVPLPQTYRHLYLVWHCASLLNANTVLDSGDQAFLTSLTQSTTPGVPVAQRYVFKPIGTQNSPLDVNEVARRFVEHLIATFNGRVRTSGRCHELESYLQQAILLVVPFYRQIDYTARDLVSTPGLGGNPGGCLFALLLKARGKDIEINEAEDARRLRRSAVAASWLLQQAALAEGDSQAEIERRMSAANRMLLRDIAHAVDNPFNAGLIALDEFVKACGGINSFRSDADRMRRARALLRQAHLAIKSIENLVRLDPELCPPEQIAETSRRMREGTTNLFEALLEIHGNYLRTKPTDLVQLISVEPRFQKCRVVGSLEAWSVVLQLLLKNATEAAPPVTASVQVELVYDPHRKWVKVFVRNELQQSLDGARLLQMNRAIHCEVRQLDQNIEKASSQGLGLVTVGRFLAALKVDASYRLDRNQVILQIGPVNYHDS